MLTLVLILFILITWQLIVLIFQIKEYLLPTPVSIIEALYEHFPIIVTNTGITLTEALLGLLFATVLGILIGFIFYFSPTIEQGGQPIVAGFQSFPKEALAPLLVIWFGYGWTSKIVLAASISFFPIFVSFLKGIKSIPIETIYYFKSMRVVKYTTLLKLRLPYTIPYFFSGFRVASTLSIIGAVIGEFIGSSEGIGHLILIANSNFSIDLVFACLVILGAIGIVFDYSILFIEKITIPWHDSFSKIENNR